AAVVSHAHFATARVLSASSAARSASVAVMFLLRSCLTTLGRFEVRPSTGAGHTSKFVCINPSLARMRRTRSWNGFRPGSWLTSQRLDRGDFFGRGTVTAFDI